jgi:hypothetical protein
VTETVFSGVRPTIVLDPVDVFNCGYAPRFLARPLPGSSPESHDRLVIGSKDGSVTLLTNDGKEKKWSSTTIQRPTGPRPAIRKMVALDQDHLILGCDGARLSLLRPPTDSKLNAEAYEIVDLNLPTFEVDPATHLNSAGAATAAVGGTGLGTKKIQVRHLFWLSTGARAGVLFASVRDRGTFRIPISDYKTLAASTDLQVGKVSELESADASSDTAANQDEPQDKPEHRGPGLGSARVIAKAIGNEQSPALWLLGSDWNLWTLEAPHLAATRVNGVSLWRAGERPTVMNDCARLGSAPGETDAWILATDTGVFFLPLVAQPQIQRLSLPGIGYMAMSVTYVRAKGHHLLWVTDYSGDTHLFWAEVENHSGPPTLPRFRRTGLVQTERQSLTSLAWSSASSESKGVTECFVAHLCRNDVVRLVRYDVSTLESSRPGPSSEERKLSQGGPHPQTESLETRWRKLLAQGTYQEIIEDWNEGHETLLHLADGSPGSPHPAPPYAGLASWLEWRGRALASRSIISDFLASPSSHLFLEVLAKEAEPSQKALAIETLALALVGLANRLPDQTPDQRLSQHLGVLQLLRELAERADAEGWAEETVRNAIRRSIRHTRKWGLFGNANALRENLALPLHVIEARHQTLGDFAAQDAGTETQQELLKRELDYLSYQSLLFWRGLSQRGKVACEAKAPVQRAWGMSVLPLAEDLSLAAVSWSSGALQLFRVRRPMAVATVLDGLHPAEAQEPVLESFGFLPSLDEVVASRECELLPEPPMSTSPAREGEGRVGPPSRDVLLVEIKGQPHLLTAFERPASAGGLQLWKIDLDSEFRVSGRKTSAKISLCRPPRYDVQRASPRIYSLVQVCEGHYLAGLAGTGDRPQLQMCSISPTPGGGSDRWNLRTVELTERGTSKHENDASELEAEEVDSGRRSRRGRVWSLAPLQLGDPDRTSGDFPIAVGCEDGSVWRVTLSIPPPTTEAGARVEVTTKSERVAQLASPVKVLHYHQQRLEVGGSSTQVFERITAGGGDGSVVCFQRLPSNDTCGPARFASLWATWERSEPSAIFSLSSAQETPTLCTTTRAGRVIQFDDRPQIAKEQTRDRPAFPGNRRGRLRLGFQAFAAALLWNEPVSGQMPRRAYAGLLVASGQGQVRIVTLHYPYSSATRSQSFKQIVEGFTTYARDQAKEPIAGKALAEELHYQVRIASTVNQASSLLSAIPLHWLLGTDLRRESLLLDLNPAPKISLRGA